MSSDIYCKNISYLKEMLEIGETKESAPTSSFGRVPLLEFHSVNGRGGGAASGSLENASKRNFICRVLPMYFACAVFAIVIFTLFFFTSHQDEQKLIFLYRDAGEFYGLYPVQQKMLEEQSKRKLNSLRKLTIVGVVIDGGTAPLDSPRFPGVRLLSSYGVHMGPAERQRNASIPDLDVFVRSVAGTSPGAKGLLVSGMVSQGQIDIAVELKGRAFKVFGFDDGFSLWSDSSWPGMMAKQGALTDLMVTASELKGEVERRQVEKELPSTFSTSVVGSPTFLEWEEKTEKKSQEELFEVRQYMFGEQDPHFQRPGCLFFGGYGEGYYTAVSIFAKAAAELKTNMSFAFVAHPGPFNTSRERSIFDLHGAQVKVLNRSKESTAVFAKVANVTASQGSTCGPQSLSIGVNSVYVLPIGAVTTDVFAKNGLIPVARNGSAAATKFEKLASKPFDRKELSKAGIPSNSLQLIVEKVKACVYS